MISKQQLMGLYIKNKEEYKKQFELKDYAKAVYFQGRKDQLREILEQYHNLTWTELKEVTE